jgi:hypothetical protein
MSDEDKANIKDDKSDVAMGDLGQKRAAMPLEYEKEDESEGDQIEESKSFINHDEDDDNDSENRSLFGGDEEELP